MLIFAHAAAFAYAGRFTQQTTGAPTQTATLSQRVEAMPRSLSLVAFSGTETANGAGFQPASFNADVAQRSSTYRIGSNVTLLQFSARGNGIAQTVVYGAGNGVVDQSPNVPFSRWSDGAARSSRIVDSFAGSSVDDVYAGDGSYVERAVPVQGLTANAQTFADGNGVYQWPYEGGSVNSSITFSPPVDEKMNVTLVNGAQHITEVIQYRSWYPFTPLVLAQDSFEDAGIVDVPRSCGVTTRFLGKTFAVQETALRIDLVFGEYEVTTRTRYISPSYGLVCLTVDDTLKSYYNYTALAFSSSPLSVTTTQETLGLQSEAATKTEIAGSAGLPLDVRMTLAQSTQRATAAADIYRSLALIRKHRT